MIYEMLGYGNNDRVGGLVYICLNEGILCVG